MHQSLTAVFRACVAVRETPKPAPYGPMVPIAPPRALNRASPCAAGNPRVHRTVALRLYDVEQPGAVEGGEAAAKFAKQLLVACNLEDGAHGGRIASHQGQQAALWSSERQQGIIDRRGLRMQHGAVLKAQHKRLVCIGAGHIHLEVPVGERGLVQCNAKVVENELRSHVVAHV